MIQIASPNSSPKHSQHESKERRILAMKEEVHDDKEHVIKLIVSPMFAIEREDVTKASRIGWEDLASTMPVRRG